ncbi:MAG: S8 family serine peptidase [Gammaproteobacteria bacterium]
MKLRVRIASAALLVLGTLSIASAATPVETMASTAQDRLIVITVADDVRVLQGRVGSTPRGYDGLQRYETSGAARATMKAIAGEYHLTQLADWPIPLLKVHCAVFEIPKDSTQAAVLERLKTEPRVRLAQAMGVFETRSETYNDPYVGLQSGFKQLDVADAHGLSRGDGVRVAVIDTGVDVGHPDLANKVVATRDLVGGTAEQFRRDRHGTEVTGVIAALANNHLGIVGVAPGVKLIALKACWQLADDTDAARCNSFTLAKAISAAIDLKSQVVNLSLGGPSDPLLAQLVQSGIRRGIVFVGAASGPGPGFPQDVPGVLAVSASESGASTQHQLHAPGREILTLLPKGHYDFASGSSLAVAHVTGTVALMLAHHPDLNSARIYDLLDRTSAPLVADDASSRSINACVALESIDQSRTGRVASSDRCGSTSPAQTARATSEHRY